MEPAEVERRELDVARDEGWGRLSRIGEDLDPHVESLLLEEAPVLRVHDLRGRLERQDGHLDGLQLLAAAWGRDRGAPERNQQQAEQRHGPEPQACSALHCPVSAHSPSLSPEVSRDATCDVR